MRSNQAAHRTVPRCHKKRSNEIFAACAKHKQNRLNFIPKKMPKSLTFAV